jgi:Tfp pilus assembly protein PilE
MPLNNHSNDALRTSAHPIPSASYGLDSGDDCGTFILNNNGDQSVSTDKADCW